MNILQAIADPNLFAAWFKDHETWAAWRVFLAALFGLPIEDEALYAACTGGRPLPTQQAREACLIVGRRGGKSFICSLVAVYLAAFRIYQLAPGERGIVMLLAADRRQARVLFRYVKAFIEGVAMLRQMVENITADAIELNNGITIEIHTAILSLGSRLHNRGGAYATRLHSGGARIVRTPTLRSWPRCAPPWPRYLMPCYCASARPTAAPWGALERLSTAFRQRRAMCLSGKPPPGP